MLSFDKFYKHDEEVEGFAKNLVDVIFFTEDDSTMKFGFFQKINDEIYIYYKYEHGKYYAEYLEDCYVCVISVSWE